MRRNYKKVLAVGLSCAMVVSTINVTGITVMAELSTKEMVANSSYNVALGKTITANPSKGEGSEEVLSDGIFTPNGDHAATTFNTKNTYYEIDLGNVYDASTIDRLVVGYKEKNDGDTPVKGYEIQYSSNGLQYTTVKNVSASDVTGQITEENLIEEEDLTGIEGKVRYVRLFYPDAYGWGIQATEIAILDIDGNLALAEVTPCADAKSVSVRTDDYNQITYSIEADENQEDFKYLVYLQDGSTTKLIGNAVNAGVEYTVDGISGGIYQLRVVACVGDSASAGIVSEYVTVLDLSSLIYGRKNVANSTTSPYSPQIVEMSSLYSGHSLDTAQKALDGNLATGEGAEVALRTGSGSPQYFVINLGEYYTPSEMEQVILAYTNANTYASDVTVEFSLDGETYTEVGNAKGYNFKQLAQGSCSLNGISLNKLENYTEKAVRFVKVTLSGGTSTWGYVVNEVGVIANTDTPTIVGSNISEAADVTISQDELDTFTYNITAGENQEDATYVVYLGNTVINNDAKAGVDYKQENVEAGSYVLKICKYEEGWLSKGITKTIIVDGYINYIDSSYNVANGRISPYSPQIVEVSSFYSGHSIDTAQKAVDGNLATGEGPEVAMRTGASSPQHFVVDLGAYYTPAEMKEVMLVYSNASTYASDAKIEFSLDGEKYSEVGNVKGYNFTLANQRQYGLSRIPLSQLDDYTEDAVRFVRVTLSGGGNQWGYVVNEVVVMANTEKPTVIESNISDAADVKLSQNKLETLTYEIVAGEDQEDATYVVYLGTKVINNAAKAGVEYTCEGVMAGDYTVKVCTLEGGWLSKGITNFITVDGYENYIGTSLNLALKKYHPEVTVTTDGDNIRTEDWNPLGQDISGGVDTVNNGIWWDYGHHTGYLQTRPDRRVVNVDYDLGKDYKPEDIHSLISMYADEGTAATDYEIFFSGDGENFESVYSVTNAPFEKFMVAKVDTSQYTQESVRYIRYRMLEGRFGGYYNADGSINWAAIGYLLCELAVMGNEELLPEKIGEFSAVSEAYNQIVVNWKDLEGEGYYYGIYLDDVYLTSYSAGVETTTLNGIKGGNHKVQVSVIKDGMERLSDGITVFVTEEPTTQKPTTEKPTTEKQTTTAPKPTTSVTTTKKVEVTTTKKVVKKPGKTAIKKIAVKKKKASLTLKKVKGATGYRIKYSLKKNMKKAKYVSGKYKIVVKKLKSKKTYYFAAQAYVKKNGKKVYGAWSSVKKSKKIK